MKSDKKSRSYRRYDASFKSAAVEQMRQGRSIKELSISLGVSEGLLYQWRSKVSQSPKDNSGELKRLKRENKRLEEQNDILKKALSIFSQSP
jgi:transposase